MHNLFKHFHVTLSSRALSPSILGFDEQHRRIKRCNAVATGILSSISPAALASQGDMHFFGLQLKGLQRPARPSPEAVITANERFPV